MKKSIFYYDSSIMNKPDDMPNHIHSSYEIYYLETGRCRYLINNKLYEIEPDDIVFIPKEVIHKTTYPCEHSRLLINCSDEYLGSFPFPEASVFRFKSIALKVKSIMKEIEKEYSNPDEYSEALIHSAMIRMLSLINRNIALNEYEEISRESSKIQKILNYIQKNYTYDLTLSSTADKFSLSHEHLSRLFKKETGVGFNEYLSLKRMRMAAELLKEENGANISEVASRCGFDDSNYFSMKFKKTYGKSPLQYRKSFYR